MSNIVNIDTAVPVPWGMLERACPKELTALERLAAMKAEEFYDGVRFSAARSLLTDIAAITDIVRTGSEGCHSDICEGSIEYANEAARAYPNVDGAFWLDMALALARLGKAFRKRTGFPLKALDLSDALYGSDETDTPWFVDTDEIYKPCHLAVDLGIHTGDRFPKPIMYAKQG
jgi:hypothetical protein